MAKRRARVNAARGARLAATAARDAALDARRTDAVTGRGLPVETHAIKRHRHALRLISDALCIQMIPVLLLANLVLREFAD